MTRALTRWLLLLVPAALLLMVAALLALIFALPAQARPTTAITLPAQSSAGSRERLALQAAAPARSSSSTACSNSG